MMHTSVVRGEHHLIHRLHVPPPQGILPSATLVYFPINIGRISLIMNLVLHWMLIVTISGVPMAEVIKKFFVASMFMWIVPIAILYGFNHNIFP
ncbi:hypothetical protein FRX31_034639, partial [Thalictrum thalictroides]